MKKTLLSLLIVTSIVACNSNPPHGEAEHQCSEKCMKMNNSNPSHGESGHKCSEECMKMTDETATHSHDMETKEHICTDDCKEGKHLYAHGEEGHVCSPNGCK